MKYKSKQSLFKKEEPDEIYLKPGEKVPENILTTITEINSDFSDKGKTQKKKLNFPNYMKRLQDAFRITTLPAISNSSILYLGGFIEGEASLNVSAKKNNFTVFKLGIDPEFSITQHINGISNLLFAMSVFKTGRLRYKSGSNATFVFIIDNREALRTKVIPFYEKYVFPYGSPQKKRRAQIFTKILDLFEKRAHLDHDRMINEILPLWDSLRMQVGQSNQTFQNLEEAQNYVREAACSNLKNNKKN